MQTKTNSEATATQQDRFGGWIQTAAGRKFYPLDPRPEDVDVVDIAHALANICRFTGHTRVFYSVAQHSVIASMYANPGHELPVLLHDAAEAYLGDIARPWKRYLMVRSPSAGWPSLKDVEKRLLEVIFRALDCPPLMVSDQKEIDRLDAIMLATEARDLMSPLLPEWHHTPENGFQVLPDEIKPWSPLQATRAFLNRFHDLKGGKAA